MDITAKDVYDNLYYLTPSDKMNITIPALFQQQLIDSQNGTIIVYFSTTTSGLYNIEVETGGSPLDGSPYPVTILAGVPTLATSTVQQPTSSGHSGVNYTMVLTARDQYGNIVDQSIVSQSPLQSTDFSVTFTPDTKLETYLSVDSLGVVTVEYPADIPHTE